METSQVTDEADLAQYEAWVRSHPQGSLWQSLEWKTYQEALGREVRIFVAKREPHGPPCFSCLVVIDRTVGGWSTWDVPRGPLWDATVDEDDLISFMTDVRADALADRCLSWFVSPLSILFHPQTVIELGHPSRRHEQPEATRIIDLTAPEEEILRQMKPKGRYNISVAERHAIEVHPSQDIPAFVELLKKTGHRDNFTIHPMRHYETFLRELPGSFLLLAFSSQAPIAGLLGVMWNAKASYYYGASDYDHRALMAPYALQWAAMRHCKAIGCTSYDLLGIAPPNAGPEHPWQGVSMFKEKFGGQVVIYPLEQEIVLRPMVRRLLQLKRKFVG